MLVDMAAGATRAQSELRDSSYAIRFKRSGLSERRDKASRCVLSRLHSAAIGRVPLQAAATLTRKGRTDGAHLRYRLFT